MADFNGTPKDPKVANAQDLSIGLQSERLHYIAIEDLSPDARNPRRHDQAQIRAIAKSIDAFGFNAPILVDKARTIIAGHGRYEAAKICGHIHVPVIFLDHLNEAQARAYMLADNKLTDRSSWDEKALALQLKELQELVLDFDMEATGFELPELDIHIQSLADPEVSDTADTFRRAIGPAVSRVNDLWHLGDHRLLCGSALDTTAYETLLAGKLAAMVFTDPPYNVRIHGHVCGSGKKKHREFAMASGEMTEEAFTAFLRTAFEAVVTRTNEGGIIYACMDWRHISEICNAGRDAGLDLQNLCVWVKSNGGMGSLYRSMHELVFVFRNGQNPHMNNVQLGRFGRNRTNVWHYAGANSFARKGRVGGLEYHPTSKPLAMIADAIRDTTKRGDIVLDPFVGGGTTILAAERTGRRGYGIEIDPLYIDTTIARWEALTGRFAQHSTGASMSDLRESRAAVL